MNAVSGNKRNKNGNFSLETILDQAPVGILAFDDQFNVTSVNQSFRKLGILYRLNVAGIEGTDLTINPTFDIGHELLDLRKGIPFEKTLNILSAGKKNIILLLKAVPFIVENLFTGGVLILEDLSLSGKGAQDESLKTTDLEYALNNLNNFLFITDSKGVIKYAYGKDIHNFYLKEKGPEGLPLTDLFSEPARSAISQNLQSARDKHLPSSVNIEIKVFKQNHTYECRTEPLINESGKVYYIFFVFNEITGYLSYAFRLEGENKQLKESALLLEESTDGVIRVNDEGNVSFWNKPAEELFGSSRDEMLNTFFGRVMSISKDYFLIIKDKLSVSGKWESSYNFNNSRGAKKTIYIRAFRKESGIFFVFRDISEHAQAEQEMAASEQMFRDIASGSGAVVISINSDENIIYCNAALAEYLQMSEEELLGRPIRSILHPSAVLPGIEKIEKNRKQSYEIALQGRKGRVDLLAYLSPVYKADQPSGFNFIGFDVTASRKIEEDHELFTNMLESSRDGIALEFQRNIVLANDSFASIFGYNSPEDLRRKDILDLINSSDILRAAEYFQTTQEKEPSRLEFIGRKKDGSTLFIEFTISSFTRNEKFYRMIIARDITERKRAQQSIRESEEKYRNITDNIDDFLYTYENTGRWLTATFYTTSVEKVTGYASTEFITDSKLFLKIVHPDDFGQFKNKLKSLFKSRLQSSEEYEFRIINKYGNIVWVRNKINLIRGADRKIQRIYGLVSDITLRKRAEDELKVSTENLVKLNETKDKFISIISHDLRTPFTSILGFTDLLLNDEGLSEKEKKQYISFIRESSKSMLGLVNSLLDWTRLQTGRIRFEPNRMDASALIVTCINSLGGAAFQKNIRLISALRPDTFIFADQSLITQIFNNLISNAIKFTPRGGEVEISTRPSKELRFIEFVVKDTGTGISSENLNKLFRVDTKFTSEGTAGEKGSGLGLSLVKEIVEKHGGKIWVNSTVGKDLPSISHFP